MGSSRTTRDRLLWAINSLLAVLFSCCLQAWSGGDEPSLRIIEDTAAAASIASGPLEGAHGGDERRAISLSPKGDVIVWHDVTEDRLIFQELTDENARSSDFPTLPIDGAPQSRLSFCLISQSRTRCVLVFASGTRLNGERIDVLIMRYPAMTLESRIVIPLEPDCYLTGAAVSPSGERIAVASNGNVWALDLHTRNEWRQREVWSLNIYRSSTLAWSPDAELLALGTLYNLYVSRVTHDTIAPLPIRAVPSVQTSELREHARRGTLEHAIEQLDKGTLYEVGLRLHGVYSVDFFEKGNLLAASGAVTRNLRIPSSDGFVALWDCRSTRMVRCDLIPETDATEVGTFAARGSYFVYLWGGEKPVRIQEIDVESGRTVCVYQVSRDAGRLEQFAILEKQSLLIAISRAGQVLTWPLLPKETMDSE